MLTNRRTFIGALFWLVPLAASGQDVLVRLPTSASSVTAVHALPEKQRGDDIIGRPEFHTQRLAARGGRVEITVSTEPVWIFEGELPAQTSVSADASPFGFHPALAPGFGFDFAEHIGVRWHRPGLYLMWVLGQPDLTSDNYTWELFDRDVRAVPPGMRQMRNLCVCHDAMVQIPKRPLLEAAKRPQIDGSQYVEGTTYRPKDVVKYQRWVRAVVERYDGVDDMPGLTAPIKYWQVDNEPPRRREGYADLVRITSQAVKEADPTAKVLIGGLPGPRTISGTRMPPSQKVALPPDKGWFSVLRGGAAAPLSDMKITYVFSAIPSRSTLSKTMPTPVSKS